MFRLMGMLRDLCWFQMSVMLCSFYTQKTSTFIHIKSYTKTSEFIHKKRHSSTSNFHKTLNFLTPVKSLRCNVEFLFFSDFSVLSKLSKNMSFFAK